MYFDYNTADFPQRNFPSTRQLGWVADDVRRVLPALVTDDAEGFAGVAYARGVAVVAEAVKELRAEVHERMDALLREMQELRAELRLLRSAT